MNSETICSVVVGRDDRVGVGSREGAVLLVVADGAGGLRGGAAAAQFVVDHASRRFAATDGLLDPMIWMAWLRDTDLAMHSDPALGESTCVVSVIADGQFVAGASVGDSEALFVDEDGVVELTQGQKRKPLLGSGSCEPHPFFAHRRRGTIVLATDGLVKYASRDRIAAVVRAAPLSALAEDLVSTVRLPSGRLHDDVGIVCCRLGS
jgi:serine/threonine protein phosphatase PrpC